MAEFNLTILEIIILQSGAIILGIAIHFFITSRRNLDISPNRRLKMQKQFEDWKLKFYNEAELKEKELADTRQQLLTATENVRKYKMELDEMAEARQSQPNQQDLADDLAIKDEEIGILHQKLKTATENYRQQQEKYEALQATLNQAPQQAGGSPAQQHDEQLEKELQSLKQEFEKQEQSTTTLKQQVAQLTQEKNDLLNQISELEANTQVPESGKDAYLVRLLEAQKNLQEQNHRLSQIIEQVDTVNENEQKLQELAHENETLTARLEALQQRLQEKEQELQSIRQKEQLSAEMHSLLDNAYAEFHNMQAKVKKLEAEISLSKMANLEYEDLKEAHQRLQKDFEHQRARLFAQVSENQKLNARVNDLENSVSELGFHRQQLQKRILYLEELNNDIHTLADANKNLESRLKSIGELESRLNLVAEERDALLRKQEGG